MKQLPSLLLLIQIQKEYFDVKQKELSSFSITEYYEETPPQCTTTIRSFCCPVTIQTTDSEATLAAVAEWRATNDSTNGLTKWGASS